MKTIILTTFLMLGTMVSIAQNSVIDWSDLNILYLGFENKVKIEPALMNGDTYTLNGTNCLVEKTDTPNIYILKPGRGSSALLTLSSQDKEGNTSVKDKKQLEVRTLPQPTIYWGNAAPGEKASLEDTKLSIAYPSDSQLKANFEIVRWSLTSDHGSATGPGSDLSAAKSVLNKIKGDTEISIMMDVRGDDGILRRIGANWRVSRL